MTVTRVFVNLANTGEVDQQGTIANVDAGTATASVTSSTPSLIGAGLDRSASTVYMRQEGLLDFDTASLPDDAVVTAVILKIYPLSTVTSGGSFTLNAYDFDFGASITTADYRTNTQRNALTVLGSIASASLTINTFASITLTGLTVNKTGSTRIMLGTSGGDTIGTIGQGRRVNLDCNNAFHYPYLEITYTSATDSGTSPVTFYGMDDGHVRQTNATRSVVEDGTGSVSTDSSDQYGGSSGGAEYQVIVALSGAATKQNSQGVFAFDTSSIVDGSTITTATFTVNVAQKTGTPPALRLYAYDYGSAVDSADYRTVTQVLALTECAASTTISATGSKSFTLSDLSVINKAGSTRLMLGYVDYEDSGTWPVAFASVQISSFSASAAANRPQLAITYALPGSGQPVGSASTRSFRAIGSGTLSCRLRGSWVRLS